MSLYILFQTTRLGKLVNEMRKKTKNDSLARRAKDLVRRWRDMVAKPSENGAGGTGQGHGQGRVLFILFSVVSYYIYYFQSH